MLDNNALSQLNQLKKDIIESKEYATGKVIGTNNRFGFVRLDDGRDAFLNPEKMQRVLPGDLVKICVVQKDAKKWEAELESLEKIALERFIGIYHQKDKAHFVEPKLTLINDRPDNKNTPSAPELVNRWLFVPPNQRKQCNEGDYVLAELSQHPFKDGRAQVRILKRIGPDTQNKHELKITQELFHLDLKKSADAHAEAEKITDTVNKETWQAREDLSALPFITIDNASTRDMDDAIAIKKDGDNTQLFVAIADPGSYIAPDSLLAKQAQEQAQSAYFIGGVVPMLPAELANDVFSLAEKQIRPVLICQIDFGPEGEIKQYAFSLSKIRSQFKLSYDQATALIEDTELDEANTLPDNIRLMLKQLAKLSELRLKIRREHALVGAQQQEYNYELDERGHILGISPRERKIAHQLVEECMIVTNICAGEYLKAQQCGLFSVHTGFRDDRLGEVKALLREENIEHDTIKTLPGYIDLFQKLKQNEQQTHLTPVLQRFTSQSQVSLTASPHFGMGLEVYAPVTSPIRRFADLYNHWCLRALLEGRQAPELSKEQLDSLNERSRQLRQAEREAKQWLYCLYLQAHIGDEYKAKIRIVTQQGFGARLDDNGIDGFLLAGKNATKTFDAKRMTITIDNKKFQLEDEVSVSIQGVDIHKRRISLTFSKAYS